MFLFDHFTKKIAQTFVICENRDIKTKISKISKMCKEISNTWTLWNLLSATKIREE